jgi:type II restriction/modification system DNA methylase subunit YeeA
VYLSLLPTLSAQDFVAKWSRATLKESSAAQEHFIDLCHLIGHPTPAEADPTGQTFAFEAGASKQGGGEGWADVWKKGYFAWEYKGKHKDLDQAYKQLLQYRESLLNPPLLIVSDIDRIVIHTNFTNTVKQVVRIQLEDLLKPEGRAHLRAVFFEPETFRVPQTTEQVTQEAARDFAHLADLLRKHGAEPQQAAHFLIRLLFCLFAEDIGLLPKDLFTQLVRNTQKQPSVFKEQLRVLFRAMASGGWFGASAIAHFDGRLFEDDSVLELDSDGLEILVRGSALDWSNIEPSIFGTLFERSLDPEKRSQIGAHYTSKEDILLIVEPVLMAPLRRRWQEVRQKAFDLAHRRDEAANKASRDRLRNELSKLLRGFAEEIAKVRVLDSACGSANFLYVALKQLLDLEKEVVMLSDSLGMGRFFPSVSPAQLHGIEINRYAHELAQATIWIGYIQWLHENGFGIPPDPILKPIDTILHMDAVLTYDEKGQPVEPQWPEADFVIGNPPFLGDKKMRAGLGDKYVDDLRWLYAGRIPGQSDLVCYWFEKARALIETGKLRRAGLLATQGIRGGANRRVLDRIKKTGDIFWAQSDRDWVLDGATVHVSMVGFDGGEETQKELDGVKVDFINPDLSSAADLTSAEPLSENQGLSFIGTQKTGPFDLTNEQAKEMLAVTGNPNGRPNSDVIKPWIDAIDIAQNPREMWIIDFGTDMPIEEASQYEKPFEHVRKYVKPKRDVARRKNHREKWWLFGEARPGMRMAISGLSRYIATPRVSKYRILVWVSADIVPESSLVAITREDDYFFGVLHSKVHELWALRMGTQLREAESGFRYTPTTTFKTFPFPWAPGREPREDQRLEAIAQAARELVEKRDAWLNPTGLTENELRKRTLTNLYNQRPTWLDIVHRKLDEAVLDTYGWPHNLSDEEMVARLLSLNLERALPQSSRVGREVEPVNHSRAMNNKADGKQVA